MSTFQPGALVRYSEREWVVLPSDDPGVILLRPIDGSGREVCGVFKPFGDRASLSERMISGKI